ncbi:Protein-L-isoaspartate O-methyltransferase [Candidatus Desulfarcum epimagneticum]|uniref:Protein-L-isoaspartate O-methyltransferase n=1 Tax=uncultured Desulfobacteraceae bacterium TaxID=218296 RepID=A0A484HNJ0_9BACT|nr:Protein-L-isoaspartate O-methyltransferase [uncultured Desulfobacteraceae bacterium]
MPKEKKLFKRLREEMVATQIEARGITDKRTLDAMRRVPRHLFVSEALENRAYGDHPLPIRERQTISQPFIVAEMTQALAPGPDDRVLEVGTGSGYQAAVLAELAFRVYTIERIHSLFTESRRRFDRLGCHNIVSRYSDGAEGWPDESPFDAIIVTAGAPDIPDPLVRQLAEGGRMVIPVGGRTTQELVKIEKLGDEIRKTRMGGCRFVPLIGGHGWAV